MPTKMKADITHLVQPYYEKGVEQGLQKGRQEGGQDAHLKDAEKMLTKGYPLKDVLEITGLKKRTWSEPVCYNNSLPAHGKK